MNFQAEVTPGMCKPTFIVAGAARSGTTSLYHWLEQHPQVFMSPVKETNYFANLRPPFTGPGDDRLTAPIRRRPDGLFEPRHAAIVSGWADYLALFAGAEGYTARGEVSPSYLYVPGTAARIRQRLPEARILVVLRRPIERAFSNYKVLVAWGRETVGFDTAIQLENERLAAGWEHIWALTGLSLYASSVKEYLDAFPRQHIGLWLYEDLTREPERVYRELCDFIGVTPVAADLTPRNPSFTRPGAVKRFLARHDALRQTVRAIMPAGLRTSIRAADSVLSGRNLVMRPQTKAWLKDYFREDILALHKLLPEYNFIKWLEE